MASVKSFGSVKRFGVRYGRKLKARIAEIESESKKRQVCPYCHKSTAKRIAFGIWICGTCKNKFTGSAYTVKAPVTKEEIKEIKAE